MEVKQLEDFVVHNIMIRNVRFHCACVDGWVCGCMDACVDGWVCGCMDACVDGWVCGCMDACVDGWVCGCVNG